MRKRAAMTSAITLILVGALMPMSSSAKDDAPSDSAASVARGRYLVKITGCAGCHSAGYDQSAGKLPDAQWLTGNPHGFIGPWGTTYAVNLRLYMQPLSAADWLKAARGMSARPPMPWFEVRDMEDNDLLAIYAFIHSLGPAGGPAPAYQPPAPKSSEHP